LNKLNVIKNYIIFSLIGAGLTACSSFSPQKWKSNTAPVDADGKSVTKIDSIVRPYRDSISVDMNTILGYSPMNLVKDRPCSPMNNWAADALFRHQTSRFPERENVMVLINVGGLRGSINEGPITKGELFSFMPFDNEVVWVKMPNSALQDIQAYIVGSGGEPISNAVMEKGTLSILNMKDHIDYFWVITSDYLMNGGDRMNFFKQKLDVFYPGVLLRDAYLQQVQIEKTLIVDQICRIDVD
jgi:2',3'-cyclic-nucleotide 2'-phosphodiesterase (5'-nucleotidase family)